MPRPPMISRESAIEAALKLIDARGVERLTMRAVATELGVNVAALYYYFGGKDDLLGGVMALVLAGMTLPATTGDDLGEWTFKTSRAYLDALTAHPNIVPLLAGTQPRSFGHEVYDYAAAQMLALGVAPDLVMPLIDVVEAFVIGWALLQMSSSRKMRRVPAKFKVLRAAIGADSMNDDQRFELAARAVISGALSAAAVPVS